MVAPSLSSRGKPAKLLKKGTETTKSHRFETFSSRVSKLKINPIHRVRRTGFGEEDGEDDENFSHFRSSLDHWSEMNLSEFFTEFVRRVSPLSENLPQVLYHEEKIMELLIEFIDKRDKLSIEPLLSLISQFARDLGVRFEGHFAASVTLVASVAATHSDVEVIEWSFTCLAWIFKFLSRLLVPDLRQLLNIMTPYLGKERQKPFVARFAAESMSFLIRKAGLVYHKNKAPLNRAISFLFDDLRNSSESRSLDTYQEGLMVMFSEAIKGVKGGLYSNASDILQCLLDNAIIGDELQLALAEDVVCGVLTNIIHATTSETFSELLKVVCAYAEADKARNSNAHLNLSSHVLFVCVATRKATRVKDWKAVHRILLLLLQRALGGLELHRDTMPRILTSIAYALQHSPMDEMMPFMRPTMEAVFDERLASLFLPFCSTFSEFGSERFQIIVLPYFQRFLASFWKTNEEDLCLSLIQLEDAGCVTFISSRPGFINCPADWRAHIVERLNNPGTSLDETAMLNAYARLRTAVSFSHDASILQQLVQSLHNLLVVSLNGPTLDNQPPNIFSCGQGFQTYIDLADQCNCLDRTLWQLILKTGDRFTRRLTFLEATLNYLTRLPGLITESKEDLDLLAVALIENLTSPSHPLRLTSLKILLELVKATTGDPQNTISTAIEIEESELSLQTARFLSMQVRKLGILYPQVVSDSWLSRLVPKFCFGLFSKQLAQLWTDSAETLKAISQHATGEAVVTELCMLWLQHNGELNNDLPSDEDPKKSWSEFKCPNALKIEEIIEARFKGVKESKDVLIERFNSNHKASALLPSSARARSLLVLHTIPEVAEKRSRQIVPLFLRWASTEGDSGKTLDIDSKSSVTPTAEEDAPIWAYKDRMALLGLFEKFTNPRSLFKSSEVYDALLLLTAHGDSSVQKSALKGLFTWKSASIRPYEENLLNLLDESRFREELSVFVHLDDNDSKIENGHKPEMLPILLRLLYGRMISRAALSSGSGGQSGRRKAILRVLSQMSDPDFELFVQIAFGVLYNLNLSKEGQIINEYFDLELVSERRQVGFVKMVETMLDTLQSRMHAYAIKSMDAVFYCLVRASRLLALDAQGTSSLESKASMLRELRSVGIRCLCMVFSIAPDIDWTPYVRLLFGEVINPRLENFAIENAQGVSAFHRLFHEWAVSSKSIFYLTRFSSNLLPAVIDTMTVPSARDDVKVYIMEQIIQPIVNHSTGRITEETEEMSDVPPETIRLETLAPYVDHILSHLSKLLQSSPARSVLVSAVETLSLIAPCVETSAEISSLVRICTYLLRQPNDKISPKTKSDLLRTLQHFVPLSSIDKDPSFAEEVFYTVSSLFDYFKDDQNRNVLSSVLHEFAKYDPDLEEISLLCADLNAIDTQKLDNVDYDRRLQAFAKINEKLWTSLSPKQWRPLLFNMLYHVKDEQEISIRSSASFGLKRFIERAADGESNVSSFSSLRDGVLLPALYSGVRQRSELVRSEFVSAFGHLVKLNPALPSIQDLHVLLVSGDEEASFFNNILHIQQHRRMRALRRLATEASSGKIGSSNISSFFFPLIEHFVFQVAEDETAHNLAAEAVATLGGLAEWLEWNQFRAVFRRYRGNMTSKPDVEKNMIRLLGRMTDALSNAFSQRHTESDSQNGMELDDSASNQSATCRLALTLPSPSKIANELTTHFLPFLTEFVHHKDEAQMSLRLPVAVTTIKLLKLLPEEDMAIRLPSVLLDVCYVLRSKAQDSRDNARKTLADIAIILGPSHFGYILKELRTALARGYQLHVLSFTVHSILVSTTDVFEQGSLDHCLTEAVAIVMDDIFGVVGQEKDAEDYVSQMKEVKSSKSYDSMELLAKNSSVTFLGALIAPLQLLLREKLTATLVRKIDELFRRIGLGLLRNPGAESRDMLVFCYEVIKESYADTSNSEATTSTESARNRRFLINMQGMKRGEKRGSTSSYLYKLSRFALDVLRSVLNKYSSLLTANNLAGFLPIIGDAVIQSYEEVKISAMRLLSTIIRLPLAELDRNAPTYLAEAVKVVKEAPSTNTEAAQAALKFIASVLRERKTVELRDNHLSYLLKRLTADIEEPDRQGLTFNFIRAVMDRKFLVPEIYELVDQIAKMMVTNQTRAARDLARGVYIHFLLEYPQAKTRWSKQLAFLAKNFEYQHREGRESVMEAVHRLLNKTGGDLGQDIISTFFLPVVLVMANDETSECRQLAGLLLGEFFSRADRERLQVMLKPLHAWLEQTENKQLANTGLQAMRIFFEAEGVEKDKESRFVTDALPHLVNPIVGDTESEDWETLYFSWQLFLKICKTVPSVAFSKESRSLWSNVQESLFYPHAWVKTCAANLIGLWLADLAKTNAAEGYSKVPLTGAHGLELDKEGMIQLTRGSLRSVQIPGVSEELAMQSVRNVVFLSRCFAVNGVELSPKEAQEAREDTSGDASDADAAEDDEGATNDVINGVVPSKSLLHYIFRQISDILRRETVSGKASALVPKAASMALLAAICRHMESEKLISFLTIILRPLQHLIDPNIPAPRSSDPDFQTNYKSLVTNAQEILDLLQKKLGTTEYVAQMARIQENIKARREERRVKRRIEAVADPEKFGREKKRKNERKHVKRKERGQEFRERRRGF